MAVVELISDTYLHFPTMFGEMSVEPGDSYRVTDNILTAIARDRLEKDGTVSQIVLTISLATSALATGATAGSPGSFTPGGAQTPYSMAQMGACVASPATAWTTGQHVVTGNTSHTYWSGTRWLAGNAP